MPKSTDTHNCNLIASTAILENSSKKRGTSAQQRWSHRVVQVFRDVEAPNSLTLIMGVVATKNWSIGCLSL